MINTEEEYKENINIVKLYTSEIEKIRKELSTLPEGHLTKKRSCYYQTIGNVQKGITKDPLKVKQLARKVYLSHRLKHLEWNLSLSQKISQKSKTENPMEIIQELPTFYQTLPTSYFYHPSIHEQLEKIPEGNAGHIDGLIFTTYTGIRVRSKSERAIADALDLNMIPYRYEAAIALGGELRRPDFTIFRPFDGKKFLWEHFGRMDDGEYRERMNEKLVFYARCGFLPFDNLICTYENDMHDVAHIHAMIDLYLLHN